MDEPQPTPTTPVHAQQITNSFFRVTPFSRILAAILFVTLPFLGFFIGLLYNWELQTPEPVLDVQGKAENPSYLSTYPNTLFLETEDVPVVTYTAKLGGDPQREEERTEAAFGEGVVIDPMSEEVPELLKPESASGIMRMIYVNREAFTWKANISDEYSDGVVYISHCNSSKNVGEHVVLGQCSVGKAVIVTSDGSEVLVGFWAAG